MSNKCECIKDGLPVKCVNIDGEKRRKMYETRIVESKVPQSINMCSKNINSKVVRLLKKLFKKL